MDDLSQLVAIYRSRMASYCGAEVAAASVQRDGKVECIRGAIKFLNVAPPSREITLDYGRLIVERRFLSMQKASTPLNDCLADLASVAAAGDSKSPVISFEGLRAGFGVAGLSRPGWSYHIPAGLPNAIGEPRLFDWPSEFFHLSPKDGNVWLDPPGPIGTAKLGVVPNPSRFIDDFLGMDLSRWPGYARGLVVVLPDYRARVTSVRVGKGLRVTIDCGTRGPEQLSYRAAADEHEVLDPPEIQYEMDRAKGAIEIPGFKADNSLQFFVMDRESDDVIDWVNLNNNSSYLAPQVTYDNPGGQIARLMAQGEGQQLEFKQIAETRRVIQTVVAMANTLGGTILVGVTDAGVPERLDQASARQSLEQSLRQNCDPLVPLDYEDIEVNGVPILLVRVPKGTAPPYRHRENGVYYVRRGASNFPAAPDEIRELVQQAGGFR